MEQVSKSKLFISLAVALVTTVVYVTLLIFYLSSPENAYLALFLLVTVQCGVLVLLFIFSEVNLLFIVLVSQLLFYSGNLLKEYFLFGPSLFSKSKLVEFEEMHLCTWLIILAYIFCKFPVQWIKPNLLRWEKTVSGSVSRRGLALFFVFLYVICNSQVPESIARITSALYSYFLYIVLVDDDESSLRSISMKLSLVLVGLIWFVTTGFLSPLMNMGLSYLYRQLELKKYSRILLIGFLGFGLTLLQPLKGAFRKFAWSDQTFSDKLSALVEIVQSQYFESQDETDDEEAVNNYYREILSRLEDDGDSEDLLKKIDSLSSKEIGALKGLDRAGDESLARVLEKSGVDVPFLGGETYSNLLYSFIPRVVWPDKPVWDLGHKFGMMFGFLNEEDQSTSIAFNFLAEGYMNFGYMGLYLSAIGMGACLFLIELFIGLFVLSNQKLALYFIASGLANFNFDTLGFVQTVLLYFIIAVLMNPFLRDQQTREAAEGEGIFNS